MTMASRLLKSWAMPPVSWPIASIFWLCRNWRSSSFRSVMSRAIFEHPTTCPAAVENRERSSGKPGYAGRPCDASWFPLVQLFSPRPMRSRMPSSSCFRVRGQQALNGLPDDFAGFVAENLFRAVVPTSHNTVQIFADDCVLRRFHNGRHPRAHFIAAFPFRHRPQRKNGLHRFAAHTHRGHGADFNHLGIPGVRSIEPQFRGPAHSRRDAPVRRAILPRPEGNRRDCAS